MHPGGTAAEVAPTDVVAPVVRLIEYRFPVAVSIPKYEPSVKAPVVI
jgi:hypothetical protein